MFRIATAFLAFFIGLSPIIASAEDGKGLRGDKPRPNSGEPKRERPADKGEKNDKGGEMRKKTAREHMKKHHKGRKGMRRMHRRHHRRHAEHKRRHAGAEGRGKK